MKQIIFILFSFSAFSQTLIVDSITKKPLPFATIKTKTGGFYAGENGIFKYSGDEKLHISFLGYQDQNLEGGQLRDTVFMSPKTINLPEVIISKSTIKTIGLLKTSKYSASLPISPNQEIITCAFPKEQITSSYLQKIIIPINKIKHYNKTDKLYKNARAMFRLNIYTLQNTLPYEKIFSSKPVEFIMSEREKVSIDVSDQMINLPKEGLAFGIEMLGRVDLQGNIIPENAFLRPLLTDLQSPDYKAVTYIRDVFQPENFTAINSVNEHLARDIKNYKPQDYNLAIGLEVSK